MSGLKACYLLACRLPDYQSKKTCKLMVKLVKIRSALPCSEIPRPHSFLSVLLLVNVQVTADHALRVPWRVPSSVSLHFSKPPPFSSLPAFTGLVLSCLVARMDKVQFEAATHVQGRRKSTLPAGKCQEPKQRHGFEATLTKPLREEPGHGNLHKQMSRVKISP